MANKYLRPIAPAKEPDDVSDDIEEGWAWIDVYAVLMAFEVTCPARAHAIKKLLMAGRRGSKSAVQDLEEAVVAIRRAIEIQKHYHPQGG